MDLPKIKALIDFVGRTNVTELKVTERDVTVRVFRTGHEISAATVTTPTDGVQAILPDTQTAPSDSNSSGTSVRAPIFGVLHRASAPGQPPFVNIGDLVEEGQTLFIIEAMKVFNKIAAPCAGRITFVTDVDGGEVETNNLLAEIA
ncbi:acetyl-CoA carboxylase biotin carboxyl carrier protein subunit [Agrobacterium sp. AGB01]|uniref:acetyl-CoA carboxylase biotin carboxyl carrier protein n=1 Tax=Agrobacterium sp. AGB01 TaxID=2769302 RepID=UPI00178329A6|nr:acetyl-CoA carboxylase biotin carboxyl carrier protein subunit [Agrobacterium sp. AGB01]MBD9388738.1 acetyl-CoA carboxylase biotin carboxyl carrier protein subunit [Agrobacterium sp. AGB01]